MLEALSLGFNLIMLGGLIFVAVYAVRSLFTSSDTIPQSEIDEEARRLIVEYGDGAVEAAEMSVQRAQWAKGKSTSRERAARVLRAVKAKIG